jgi:hypothetical protein
LNPREQSLTKLVARDRQSVSERRHHADLCRTPSCVASPPANRFSVARLKSVQDAIADTCSLASVVGADRGRTSTRSGGSSTVPIPRESSADYDHDE